MALDPRIEAIRASFDLDRAVFWELPQKKGTWLVKHSALEVVAAKSGIVFDNPTIIEANGADGVAALSVRGETPDGRSEWSIGEASPKNNKNAYPWAMAEKRAKDRVILKLIGIHGLVYSEDEMADEARPAPQVAPGEPEQPKVRVSDQREIYAAMRDEIDACETLNDLAIFWRSPAAQSEFKKLKPDWATQITEHKDARKAALSAPDGNPPRVAPSFDHMETAR